MSDKLSFRQCSTGEHEIMKAIAIDAESMVKEAANPVQPGETVKAQLNKAALNLGYAAGDWRVKAAWYGEAGCWGAATFRNLQERYEAWRERQERRANERASNAAAVLRSLRATLAEADPDFHREQISAIDAALLNEGGQAPSVGSGDSAVD